MRFETPLHLTIEADNQEEADKLASGFVEQWRIIAKADDASRLEDLHIGMDESLLRAINSRAYQESPFKSVEQREVVGA